jgi:glycosyltransferase involved in cell wall biosynthesis
LTKAESFLIKSADHVITVSESIAKELKKRYSVKQPSVILNTPSHHVAERTLSLHDELGIPQNYKIVLYVGNVTFNRGLEELIQSIAYLDHCVFVLMGRITNDLYYQKLKKIAQHMGVDNKVYYFGPVHSEDVTEYASSAHVGAASIKKVCLSYYYCLPNKLFEYMAAGLPVVASNFPELKKVIEGHEMGKTFNPDVPEEIAQAINHVISDKDRYDEMKTNALRAAKIFNWENESKKLLEIYKGLENEVCITSN